MRGVAQRGVREGRLDREMLVQELSQNTSLSRADAEDLANQISSRFDEVRTRAGSAVEQAKETAKATANEAADKTGKALLFGGVMMLLSLGASLGGGALGARRRDRRDDEMRREELRREELRREEIRQEELRQGELRRDEIRHEAGLRPTPTD
jgi:uncharacterized protein HemX